MGLANGSRLLERPSSTQRPKALDLPGYFDRRGRDLNPRRRRTPPQARSRQTRQSTTPTQWKSHSLTSGNGETPKDKRSQGRASEDPESDTEEGVPHKTCCQRCLPMSVWVTVIVLITYLLMLITSLTIQRSWEETVDLITPEDDEATRTALHWAFSGVLLVVFIVVAVYSSNLQARQQEINRQQEAEDIARDEDLEKAGVSGNSHFRTTPKAATAKRPAGSLGAVAMQVNRLFVGGKLDMDPMGVMGSTNPLALASATSRSTQNLPRYQKTTTPQWSGDGTQRKNGSTRETASGTFSTYPPGSNASVGSTRYVL